MEQWDNSGYYDGRLQTDLRDTSDGLPSAFGTETAIHERSALGPRSKVKPGAWPNMGAKEIFLQVAKISRVKTPGNENFKKIEIGALKYMYCILV